MATTYTVGMAASASGWSARMLRYLEQQGLVVPRRTAAGYRVYGLGELNQLRALKELRRRFEVELDEIAFAARLRREPELKFELDGWLAAGADSSSWIDWEQRKHERLLAA
ncbi:MAG TPA: MerR family transcriptional regulator [Gaiellaceae bacterium]|jgi:DNA-binding transcriptional MerR regulator